MKASGSFIISFIAIALAGAALFQPAGGEGARSHEKKHHKKKARHSAPLKHIGTKKVKLLSRTEVQLPVNFSPAEPLRLTFYGMDFRLNVFSRGFARGEAVLCEVEMSGDVVNDFSLELAFEDEAIPLSKKTWGYRGIFAIPPDSSYAWGNIHATVRVLGKKEIYHFPVKIADVQFPIYRRALQLGEYSDEEIFKKKPWLKERIEKEIEKKNEVFRHHLSDMLERRLCHPRNYHKITSSFYARRLYERYEISKGKKQQLKPRVSRHLGLDLWGDVGSPVYAIADGVVVLAEEMYYEGKQVIINHGNGIFSRYMHLHEIRVSTGQKVEAGYVVGKVGASGMVTGPHLHVGLMIRGTYVDPMSFLYLPLRD